MGTRRYFKFIHDFPRLAQESDFYFHLHRGKIDWTAFDKIDIDDIVYGRDFILLEDRLEDVINFDLERDCDRSSYILHQNFVKIFRIAQLGVNYLSYCLMHLDGCVVDLQEKLALSKDKYRRLKSKLNQTYNGTGDSHKCKECGKIFMTNNYLQSHEKRRHCEETVKRNDTATQTERKAFQDRSCQTDKFEKETKNFGTNTESPRRKQAATDVPDFFLPPKNLDHEDLKDDINWLKEKVEKLSKKDEKSHKTLKDATTSTDEKLFENASTQCDYVKKRRKKISKLSEPAERIDLRAKENFYEPPKPFPRSLRRVVSQAKDVSEIVYQQPFEETDQSSTKSSHKDRNQMREEGNPDNFKETHTSLKIDDVEIFTTKDDFKKEFQRKLQQLGLENLYEVNNKKFQEMQAILELQRNQLAQHLPSFWTHRKLLEQKLEGAVNKPKEMYDISDSSSAESESIKMSMEKKKISSTESETDSDIQIILEKPKDEEVLSIESFESQGSVTKILTPNSIEDLLKEFGLKDNNNTTESVVMNNGKMEKLYDSESSSSDFDDILKDLSGIQSDLSTKDSKSSSILKSVEAQQQPQPKKRVAFADNFEIQTLGRVTNLL